MADDQRRAKPGDKGIAASMWNTLLEVAKRHRRGPGRSGGETVGNGVREPAHDVLIEYSETTSLTEYSTVYPYESRIDQTDDPNRVARRPVLSASDENDSTLPFAIIQEPILSGGSQVVRATMGGVTCALVDVESDWHQFAQPKAWPETELVSVPYGPVRILDKSDNTGVQTCLVDIVRDDGSGWHGNYWTFAPNAYSPGTFSSDSSWHTLKNTFTRVPANKSVWVSAGVTVNVAASYSGGTTGTVYGCLKARMVWLNDDGSFDSTLAPNEETEFGHCSRNLTGGVVTTIPVLQGFDAQAQFGFKISASTSTRYIGIQLKEVVIGTGNLTGCHIGGTLADIGAGRTWVAIDNEATHTPAVAIPTTTTITAAGSGSWVVPDGHTVARVQAWGGSGGGGGCGVAVPQYSGGGGGGGAYAEYTFTGLTPGASIAYTVGAAGTAGVSGGLPTVGGDGGNTTFDGGTQLLAEGGNGGGSGAHYWTGGRKGRAANSIGSTKYDGGTGGAGGDGTIKIGYGGGGGAGAAGNAGAGTDGVDAAGATGGAGGAGGTAGGGAGGAGVNFDGTGGAAGTAPGGGGGGGSVSGSGKAGAAGKLIITSHAG